MSGIFKIRIVWRKDRVRVQRPGVTIHDQIGIAPTFEVAWGRFVWFLARRPQWLLHIFRCVKCGRRNQPVRSMLCQSCYDAERWDEYVAMTR